MRSGPISDTLAGVFATLATNSYSSERHVARKPEPLLGRTAVRHRGAGLLHLRDVPALPRRSSFDAPLVDLQRRAVSAS